MRRKDWMASALSVAAVLLLVACGRSAPSSLQSPEPSAGSVGEGAARAGGGRDASQPELRPAHLTGEQKLRVVATTGIVGDVVRNVAGDRIELTTLIGPGQDPHTYQPTPRDIAAIERANVVFINGFGLEEGLVSTIDAAAGKGGSVVSVSAGIPPRAPDGLPTVSPKGNPAASETGGHNDASDPHVWFDPTNVKVWTSNIQKSLAALDPANAASYAANATAYARQLDELDAYIREQVALIPAGGRKLVTDHEAFGYFADRYGFQVVGAVIPSVSTSAEPSAGELAALEGKIRAQGVLAVFIGTTTNPKLADLVARDTGARVLPLHTGETGPSGSGADTYIGMMRANVDTIVKGLIAGA
jgi:manganese/iron transport system substrate-binding protein